MFGTAPPPARHPYRVGFDWAADADEFGISTRDPVKAKSMTRQSLRRLHSCGDPAELEAAWSSVGRVCAALRDGGHHAEADDILDTYERLSRAMREDAEPESSDGMTPPQIGSARDSAEATHDGDESNVRNCSDW